MPSANTSTGSNRPVEDTVLDWDKTSPELAQDAIRVLAQRRLAENHGDTDTALRYELQQEATDLDSSVRAALQLREALTRGMTPPAPVVSMRTTGRWDGFVTATDAETFELVFWPTNESAFRMSGRFLVSEVPSDQRDLLVDGAPAYLTALEVQYAPGHWQSLSMVRLRRIKPIGESEIDEILKAIED